MNSIKIEKQSVLSLKGIVTSHILMDDYINMNDKEPSWDGNIYLYSSNKLRAEDIRYRVPVQVKGKNDETLLKRESITFPVEYLHLRNYLNDGGVCYFVIVISNNGKDTAIFYNTLTPIKLKSLLNKTEGKKGTQTKNITLLRLKKNASNELYKILMQFGHDSKEQGAGELIRKSLNMDDMKRIDSIRMTAFVSEPGEAIKKINKGEICLFGHNKDADMWVPFEYSQQVKLEVMTGLIIKKSFSVNGVVFYNEFRTEIGEDNFTKFILSENITLDMNHEKLNFNLITDLHTIKNDINFIKAVVNGNCLCVDGEVIVDYENMKLDDELIGQINEVEMIITAFEKMGIKCSKRIDKMSDSDWKSIYELLKLYLGEIKPIEQTAWHIWWWEDKIVPIMIFKNSRNEIKSYNFLIEKSFEIKISDENNYRLPRFISFNRDIWEKLYDVEEEILIEELEATDFNEITEGPLTKLFLEILSAYDNTKNNKYYKLLNLLCKKMLEISSESEIWIINSLQLIKRERQLSNEELCKLEELSLKSENQMVKCAVDILLENKYRAKKELDALSKSDRELFSSYPIYNLLQKL